MRMVHDVRILIPVSKRLAELLACADDRLGAPRIDEIIERELNRYLTEVSRRDIIRK